MAVQQSRFVGFSPEQWVLLEKAYDSHVAVARLLAVMRSGCRSAVCEGAYQRRMDAHKRNGNVCLINISQKANDFL